VEKTRDAGQKIVDENSSGKPIAPAKRREESDWNEENQKACDWLTKRWNGVTISPGLHKKGNQQAKLPQGNKKSVDENSSRKAIAPAKCREESDWKEEKL